jgi:hypothetical protein
LIVCTQEFVWSVAKARWPVSATVNAASIVSRSRISPISTTSGSCRRMYLRALVKLLVSAPTSLWFTTQPLCGCRYSIGSSMVTMCSFRSVLILSMIVASVVDFPEPVGPVTRMRPRGFFESSSTILGRPSSSKVLILYGIARKAPATAPRWVKMLARKRERPRTPNERSSSFDSSNLCFCASVRIE